MTEVDVNRDKYHLIEQMNAWLRENVGPGGWLAPPECKWKVEGAFGHHTYYFKDPKDAVMFKLRWA